MYKVLYSHEYKKSYRRVFQQVGFPEQKLKLYVDIISSGENLPFSAHDHKLEGKLSCLRQCHLKGDLLLQYRIDEYLQIITLVDIGTHHQLLGL